MNSPDGQNNDGEIEINDNQPLLGSNDKDKEDAEDDNITLSDDSQKVLFEDEEPPKKLKLNRD
jgi:hypothetical protein